MDRLRNIVSGDSAAIDGESSNESTFETRLVKELADAGAGGPAPPSPEGGQGDEQNLSEEEIQAMAAMLAAAAEVNGQGNTAPRAVTVSPTPGICIKTASREGKVFVNLCKSEHIPPPPAISDAELARVVQTFDASRYRVPCSVGPAPHAELDKAGKGCTVYDVVVNDGFFDTTLKEREGIRDFVIELSLASVEHKHKTLLSREYNILKRRTHMGAIQDQTIRSSMPVKPKRAAGTSAGGPLMFYCDTSVCM